MTIYDGLVGQPDDYHQWFHRQHPEKQAEACWPTLNMNGEFSQLPQAGG
jgi:hypothetical protein